MSHDVLRRLMDDAYRAQESGMSVGLPRVSVDASQLRLLLAGEAVSMADELIAALRARP